MCQTHHTMTHTHTRAQIQTHTHSSTHSDRLDLCPLPHLAIHERPSRRLGAKTTEFPKNRANRRAGSCSAGCFRRLCMALIVHVGLQTTECTHHTARKTTTESTRNGFTRIAHTHLPDERSKDFRKFRNTVNHPLFPADRLRQEYTLKNRKYLEEANSLWNTGATHMENLPIST